MFRTLLFAALLVSTQTRADPAQTEFIDPTVSYNFEESPGPTHLCKIVLGLSDYPKSHAGKFVVFSASNAKNNSSSYGYTMSVGNIDIRNGLPTSTTTAPITDAKVISNTFLSAPNMERLKTGGPDAAYAISGPSDAVRAERLQNFLALMRRGDYLVVTKLPNEEKELGFSIKSPPPSTVWMQFLQCGLKDG